MRFEREKQRNEKRQLKIERRPSFLYLFSLLVSPFFRFRVSGFCRRLKPRVPASSGVAGQSIVEMVFLIPLLLMLVTGALFVVYCCSQGIKVQQAANLAARIQGQEGVNGGLSLGSIQADNGVYNGADGQPLGVPDLGQFSGALSPAQLDLLRTQREQQEISATSVYGKIQAAVQQFFTSSERTNLWTLAPVTGNSGISYAVNVIRVIMPPNVFGLNLQPLTLGATAYGGEDPHEFGLPRWGSTDANGAGGQFWTQKDSQGNYVNLPKGNN